MFHKVVLLISVDEVKHTEGIIDSDSKENKAYGLYITRTCFIFFSDVFGSITLLCLPH